MNITLIASLCSAATATVLSWGAAWQIQNYHITQLRLEYANERIAIQRQARATLERNMSAVTTAQAKAAERVVRLAADNARAVGALDSLRTASASALRSAAGDLATCTAALSSHAIVVGKCSQEVVRLASDLDDWAGSVILYQDAWLK